MKLGWVELTVNENVLEIMVVAHAWNYADII